eukprot:5014624-Pyramimonas_sp.AAC.1
MLRLGAWGKPSAAAPALRKPSASAYRMCANGAGADFTASASAQTPHKAWTPSSHRHFRVTSTGLL